MISGVGALSSASDSSPFHSIPYAFRMSIQVYYVYVQYTTLTGELCAKRELVYRNPYVY
jgi:hypothetical protein